MDNNAYNGYIPNYDYVPMYNEDNLNKEEDIKKLSINEEKSGEEITVADSKYCYNCGNKLDIKRSVTSSGYKETSLVLGIICLISKG